MVPQWKVLFNIESGCRKAYDTDREYEEERKSGINFPVSYLFNPEFVCFGMEEK